MSPATVDTRAILALHEQVYAALQGRAAPWFLRLLRRPEEVADFTDRGRRKMPALMCGADNNYLALTRRQIDTIRKAGEETLFTLDPASPPPTTPTLPAAAPPPTGLTPRNLLGPNPLRGDGQPGQLAPGGRGRQLLPRPRGRLPRGMAAHVQGAGATRIRQSRC